jgi:hypothetical protein
MSRKDANGNRKSLVFPALRVAKPASVCSAKIAHERQQEYECA